MELRETFGTSTARLCDGTLTIGTGKMERTWQWTGDGFGAVALRDLSSGAEWAGEAASADWRLPGWGDANPPAELVSVTTGEGSDEGFTSPHLAVMAEMLYPAASLRLRFTVWAFPGAMGLRTQLKLQAMAGYEGEVARSSGRVERVPCQMAGTDRRLFGYYNDTQNRNDTHLDILEEAVVHGWAGTPEHHRWPSVVCVEGEKAGFALVQESHKCTNQKGHDTGLFRALDEALELDGWGLLPQEVRTDCWSPAWGAWLVVYASGDLSREQSLKDFDRLRYPIDPARDIYILANTWGSTRPGPAARDAASESNVLVEIDSQADLGIDFQQVDDGWQGNQYQTFVPDPERYPKGWTNIVAQAAAKGVKLGLWGPGQPISLDDLKRNYDHGGFLQYKLDFVHFRNHAQVQELIRKIRAFVLYTGHRVRVNWDVTENQARFGYYLGREYGTIYLENRKDCCPEWVVYKPHTVLRDIWQVSRYLTANRFQASVQNIDRVDPAHSDGPAHSHAYCVAITLMATPLFFQETRHYSAAARTEVRDLLAVYKQHREAIYGGTVHPIGSKPDNRSWTGFQCILPGSDAGYLTIFREIGNPEPSCALSLHHVAGATLACTDLRTKQTWHAQADAVGKVQFEIPTAPDFRFLRYERLG
jgi:hypothetical protein